MAASAVWAPAFPAARQAGENLPQHPRWKFVFVNFITTHPFFVPTQFGAADAAALLGVTYEWTGSARFDVPEMVDALDAAIRADVAGPESPE